MLGDEAAAVLGDEGGELVKDPAVDDLWGHQEQRRTDDTVSCLAWRARAKMAFIGSLFCRRDLDPPSAVWTARPRLTPLGKV